ncbi:MAG: hypothetical protein COW63_08570 [Bacteroidetes bacterium CG18_big_fil_WC_8_21_14_2_50_41_14]|nr:MAG: hypothetical protein COW63_08570 [Bacteroidetes bacterium CG18_big_fil_WC_8_21_14_2_50_41_14]PJB56897.1 MAG: hypothetical protein CO098_12725 [Bacteroidetes bacterium CG_4_9_14_3_um_filter_41_19]
MFSKNISDVSNLSGWKKPERLNTAPEKLNLIKAKNLNFGLRYQVYRLWKISNLSGWKKLERLNKK